MIKFLCFVILPAAVFASAFNKCDNVSPAPNAIRMPNCNSEYCIVKRNQVVPIQLKFTSQTTNNGIIAAAHVYTDNYWLPLSLGFKGNVCTNLQFGRCPLTTGQQAIYGLDLIVPQIVPVGSSIVVRLHAVNQATNTVFCVYANIFVAA